MADIEIETGMPSTAFEGIAIAALAARDGAAGQATAAGTAAAQSGAARDQAQLAAATAAAASHYFPTRAAGEAATAAGGLFTTGDGAGNLIYYERTADSSTEITRAVTPVSLSGRIVRHISDFGTGVVAGSAADQTVALNAAFTAAAQQGAIVMTRQGEGYRHGAPLHIPAGTVWQMNRATLIATDAYEVAVFVGDDTQILGGGLFQAPNATTRGNALDHCRIAVVGARWLLEDIEVDGSPTVGVVVFGGSFGRLVRPRVRNTKADGIHQTYGAHDNVVENPDVQDVADDFVSAVGYAGDGALVERIVIVGGAGHRGQARGLVAIGVRDFYSTGFLADTCRGAGIYTGPEYYIDAAHSIMGTSRVTIQSPTLINTCTDPSLSHAPVLVLGLDGDDTDTLATGEVIPRHADGTRIISPTIVGGMGDGGANYAFRVDKFAVRTQILYLTARNLSGSLNPGLGQISGRDTTIIQPEGLNIVANGIVLTRFASGFVRIVSPIMEQMGTGNPQAYHAFFGCEPGCQATRIEIIDARLRSAGGTLGLLGGGFPDGALRIVGATIDDVAQVDIDPIAERYVGGGGFTYTIGGAPRPKQVTIGANAVASYTLSQQILAKIDIAAVNHKNENSWTVLTEILHFDATNTSGVAGVDYVAFPGYGYYRRIIVDAAAGNLAITHTLTLDANNRPVLSLGGGGESIDLTVRAVLTQKQG